MKKSFVALSLFDGISCGQMALERAGIKYGKYFASEIDKAAITTTQTNFPKTIQLGDIQNWKEWKLPRIDCLFAGFPCPSFSNAGKGLGFDDDRGKLFFDFVDIKNHLQKLNPNLIVLGENVQMKKAFARVITDALNLDSHFVDSARVSAQTRKRLYWTNLPVKGKPKDKRIFLKDILEAEVDEKYYLTNAQLKRLFESDDLPKQFSQIGGEKSVSLMARQYANLKGQFVKVGLDGQPKANQDKASCFTAGGNSGGNHSDMDLIYQRPRGTNHGGIRAKNGKTPSITTSDWKENNYLVNGKRIRRLTPIEVCRLQTVPDDYFYKDSEQIISDSAIYRCLGNAWTVDVIAWIFGFIGKELRNEQSQGNLF